MDTRPNPFLQFARAEYDELAERVNTGASPVPHVRALVVFNPEPLPVTGRALFPVDMPWRRDREFPPVAIIDPLTRHAVLTDLVGMNWSQLSDGDPEKADGKQRLRFMLVFNVTEVPAHGYSLYHAAFGSSVELLDIPPELGNLRPELVVIETLLHTGELESRSSFVVANSRNLVVRLDDVSVAVGNVVPIVVANNARGIVAGSLTFAVPVGRVVRPNRSSDTNRLAPMEAGNVQPLPGIGGGESLRLEVWL